MFLQQLGLLRHAGLEAHGPTPPEFIHKIAEAAKLALADRTAWYGDPRFTESQLGALLNPHYLARARGGHRRPGLR